MEGARESKRLNNSVLANELLHKSLWWRHAYVDGQTSLVLSHSFQSFFPSPVSELVDMTGCYTTPIIKIKIQEVLNHPDADVRFIASYDTCRGKRSFQHQLHVYTESNQRYVLANCIDVTEMVALEREIVDAQGRLSVAQLMERQSQLEAQNQFISESYQKQSRFLALLSHELRSPLLGISSLVQRLRENQTDEAVLSALKAIHITAEQSTFLVNDILTYSQTEYDEITLHPMVFSLKETLQNVKHLTRSIAADKGLIVSLIYLGSRDRVVGDSVRLSQILINLIVNSIKFTQYGGVTIEVSQGEGGRFSFKVTDSGEGIASDQLECIFEPYSQLNSIGSTQNIGSGLGLLVVKQLVALMGGEIFVKSTLGVGTSFSFSLLFADPIEVEGHDSVGRAESPQRLESATLESAAIKNSVEQVNELSDQQVEGGASYKILIADDSKINLMVLGGYLQELNHTVVEAKNGREAWELFQKNAFDYVFLDIQMPFLDGIEVSHKIKACAESGGEAVKNLKKVFAVTAGGEESNFTLEGEPIGSNGFDHWFVKPVSKEQIIKALQEGAKKLSIAEPLTDSLKEPLSETVHTLASDMEATNLFSQESWESIEDVPEAFKGLVVDVIQELKEGISVLESLVDQGDSVEVSKKAHYLKGNCMLLQLDGMVSALREIEKIVGKSERLVRNKQSKLKIVLEKLTFGLKYLEKSIRIRHNGEYIK